MKKSVKAAVNTRRARTNFLKRYGQETYDVVRDLVKGQTRVVDWIPTSSLAAYKANLTRGTYDDFLRGCQF
jgi:trans-aconitate methyltransferase